MKKSVSLLLCMVLVFAMLPVTVVHGATEGIYTYTVSNGKATITDCDEKASGAITIPSKLGGYPVTSIGVDSFRDCDSLTSVTIPSSVTSIEHYAFYECNLLASVYIPDEVNYMGEGIFYNCNSLTNIRLSNNVTVILAGTFYNCDNLTSIVIPDGVYLIDHDAFRHCDNLTSITLPTRLVDIGARAFTACYNLKSIFYKGSEALWNRIRIDTGNYPLSTATKYYNYQDQPEEPPVISSATANLDNIDYNILSDDVVIEKGSDKSVRVTVNVERNGCQNIQIYMMQSSTRKKISIPVSSVQENIASGVVSFSPGTSFQSGEDIYLFVVNPKKGESDSKRTKLKIEERRFPDNEGNGKMIQLGKEIKFTVPENVPVFEGTEINWSFDFLPITVACDPNDFDKVQIILGANLVTEKRKVTWKEGERTVTYDRTFFKDAFDFKGYKEDIRKAARKQNRTLKQIRNDYKMTKAAKMNLFEKWRDARDRSNVVDVKGYVELSYQNGKWAFSEGMLAVEGVMEYEYQGQIFVGVFPCYYEIGGEVGAELMGKITNLHPEQFTPSYFGELSAYAEGRVGAGVGVAKVMTAGGTGQASLHITNALHKTYSKVWVEGSANLNAKVFGKTVAEKKIAQGDFLIYETGSNKGWIKDDAISLQSIEQHSLMSSIDSEKVYENENREYLEQPTLWLTTYPIQGYGAAEYTNKNLAKIADNIYTEAAPQICEIEGKKVMVLQWDNPKRADIDRTMLVYSVYNDSTKQWSEVKAVDDDGTADFYPCFRDGYLVWQNETSKLSDTMTLEKIGALGEIRVAKWNGNGFDAPKTLTNNTVLDTQPVICATKTGASAVWSVNSESDIMGVTGENTLMQADFNGSAWTTPKAIKSDLTAVTNLNAGILDGQFTVAYVTDDDNDLGTVDDRDIRLISGSSERQLTNNEVLDSNPVFENNLLYYYSEGNIQSCAADGSKLQSVFSEAKPGLHDRFVMDSNNQGDTAIWWEKTVEKGTEIYTCLLQDGVWSDEIQVTELENQTKYPSGLLNENGSMDVVFNNGIVKDGEITKTDLYMISVIPSYDLALSDVTVDEETMTVYGSVKNSGELTVNAYTVKIEGNTEQKITEPLLPGQSAEFTIVYKKPSNFTPQNIKVTVSQQEGEEYDTKNNQVSLFVGNADVAVEHVSANDSVITADISNIGYQTASDVTVQLKDGQQILEERVLHLSAGQTEQVSFTVERKDMLFLENTKQLYVTASCDQTEISLGNNDSYAYITSLSGEADYYSKILNYSQVDGKWIVNSVAGNHTGEDVACIIYSSVYDKEGKLKGTGMKKATIEAQNDTGVDIALSCTIQSGDVIKTFLWKDMMPLTEADAITVE